MSQDSRYASSYKNNRILFQQPPEKLQIPRVTGGLFPTGYSVKPRVVGYYWPDNYDDYEEEDEEKAKQQKNNIRSDGSSISTSPSTRVSLGFESLDPNMIRPLSDRSIAVSTESMKAQIHLENSKDYDNNMRDAFESGDCEAQYEWQRTSFPTCNSIHEQALWEMRDPRGSRVKLLANGYWRDVWALRDFDWEPLALKTIRYEHDYNDRNFDRHRRDAVAMQRMTSSPNVVDIYSFCGNSGVFQYASGGSLEDALWYSDEPEWNSTEKLIVAYQAASGLADLHNVDVEGRASIAHTDITPSQFVFVNKVGRFLLNDFNRCRFIAWDKEKDEACGFHVGTNPGTFRSPEEYRYDLETEKVDVYSLGNVFYALLEKQYPYEHDQSKKKAQRLIMNGERPPLSEEHSKSTDQFTRALIKAMRMCWIHEPKKRASARKVEKFIDSELTRLGVNGKSADSTSRK